MGEKLVSNRYIIGSTAITFIILMMMPNSSLLAYTDHGDGVKSSSDKTFFRVLKGDLNVCSPDYQYNVTVCQVVMKDEELSPYAGKATKSTHTNNTKNSENYTNRSNYPPLSANPEIVINEEQLQALLANSTLNTIEDDKGVRQNDTGASLSNDTQENDIRKIYVGGYPQYDPLVIEQPLEGEIVNDNTLETQQQNYNQPPLMNNQTSSSEDHTIPSEGATRQDGSSHDNNIDNTKTDTSNSYSSIPIGISFPHKN
jgi:hypothetical protein